MSDSRRQYNVINQALKQLYPEEPKGNLARHLNTLVFMVSGIIAAKSCQLPKMASEVPMNPADPNRKQAIHPESRGKQFSRWTQTENVTFELYFLPYIQTILTNLAAVRPLTLIMDGSAVARECVTLMVSVIYGHRAIPVGWLVVSGEKGHFPTRAHLELIREVKTRIPAATQVTFLGDGEFDSPELQAEVEAYGWEYTCRTAKSILIGIDGKQQHMKDLAVKRGGRVFHKGAVFTASAYGPVMVIAWWEARYKEPIYLVSNMTSVDRACKAYRKRMHIETFFSDQKSRGFQLDRSHLSEPERVERLMIAASLAYLWILYLGNVAQTEGWVSKFHRRHRCDLSLFQLGLRLLAYLLNHDLPLPDSFTLEAEKSVR